MSWIDEGLNTIKSGAKAAQNYVDQSAENLKNIPRTNLVGNALLGVAEYGMPAAQAIAHPVQTAQSLGQFVQHPVANTQQVAKQTVQGYKEYIDPMNLKQNLYEDPLKIPRDILNVADIAVGGAGAAKAAGNIAKNTTKAVTKTVVPKTQVVYHGSPTQGINNLSTKYVGSNTGMTRSGWGVNFAPDPIETDFYKAVGKHMTNVPKNVGETYTVRIPTDDVLLDFNKSLSQQPKVVQDFAKSHLGEKSFERIKDMPDGGQKLYESLGTPEEASKLLNSKGILGNKNVDFGSPEIVIYNDKNMHIINRANNKQTLMDKGRDLWYGLRDNE